MRKCALRIFSAARPSAVPSTVAPPTKLDVSAAARYSGPTTVDTVLFIMIECSELSAAELAPPAACAVVRCGGAPCSDFVAEQLVAAGVNVQTHFDQNDGPGMKLLAVVPGATPRELAIYRPP